MVWMFSGIVFIAQIVCCISFQDKFKKYLPTLIVLGFITVTVLNANLGELDPQRLANQTAVSLVGLVAIALYHGIKGVRSFIEGRRDPAQKLRK